MSRYAIFIHFFSFLFFKTSKSPSNLAKIPSEDLVKELPPNSAVLHTGIEIQNLVAWHCLFNPLVAYQPDTFRGVG